MNCDYRIKYYIGVWKNPDKIHIPEHIKTFKQNKLYWYDGPTTAHNPDFPYNYGSLSPGFWWIHGQHGMLLDIPCLTISADGVNNEGLPALVKVRLLTDISGGILCPMEYGRHWGPIKEARTVTTPWASKHNSCVWRGMPAGIQNIIENQRILCCQKHGNKHNIGITDTWDRFPIEYVKPALSIPEMLQYKYVLSLPGNDKDSGLNWKLASNSLVLMPPPEIESWLMEGLLKPYEHYVPLAKDLSDLDDIITWCNLHDKECLQIIINANSFMKTFDNIEIEQQIFENIKAHYARTFTFIS